jgi:hypothetical protein
MIRITVDEAYAFDYLSIIEIKSKNNNIVNDALTIIRNDLISQLGDKLVNEILSSEQYLNLYNANKLTFDVVDKAKKDEVTASYLDKCNYKRMISKKELQHKFFQNNLSELKIGYENIKLND